MKEEFLKKFVRKRISLTIIGKTNIIDGQVKSVEDGVMAIYKVEDGVLDIYTVYIDISCIDTISPYKEE